MKRDGLIVTHAGLLSMQVCVPKETTDEEVEEFANTANPSGLENGWKIRRQGDAALAGADERVPCCDDASRVHIMLDC